MIALYSSAPHLLRAGRMSESFETLAICTVRRRRFVAAICASGRHADGGRRRGVRGRTMAFNGICGNIGVSIASGCTAVIAAWLGWRFAFFIPPSVGYEMQIDKARHE